MIPNVFHFIYFKGRPLGWLEYLAVKSCLEVNKPEKIYFYSDEELEGEWGRKILDLVTLEKVEPINEIFGVPVPHPAHKADVLRLQKLIERGGVYLDINVICRKPFAPLYENRMVMGEEKFMGKTVGLCNAVMLAQPNENFLQRFLEGFDPKRSLWAGFRSRGPEDLYYSEISIKYSHFLANYWPEEIHIEPYTSFFDPAYETERLKAFFEQPDTGEWDNCYCHKIWSVGREKYISTKTWEEAKEGNSAFTNLVRRFG